MCHYCENFMWLPGADSRSHSYIDGADKVTVDTERFVVSHEAIEACPKCGRNLVTGEGGHDSRVNPNSRKYRLRAGTVNDLGALVMALTEHGVDDKSVQNFGRFVEFGNAPDPDMDYLLAPFPEYRDVKAACEVGRSIGTRDAERAVA